MTPYYQAAGVTLLHGDCLALLPKLPRSAAIITDPPYGIRYVHGSGGKGLCTARRHSHRAVVGDGAPFDPAPWLAFGWLLFWGADHCRAALPASGTMLAWNKRGDPPRGPDDSFADVEFAWASVRVKRNGVNLLWKGIACSKAGEDNGRRHHPTMKPVALCCWSIQVLGLPPGTLIIDPYMGSGSTGVAAVRLGYPFLGIEIEADYCATAKHRIARELPAQVSSSQGQGSNNG